MTSKSDSATRFRFGSSDFCIDGWQNNEENKYERCAWQSVHAAAFYPHVTRLSINGTWGCDWYGQDTVTNRLRSVYRSECMAKQTIDGGYSRCLKARKISKDIRYEGNNAPVVNQGDKVD